MRLTPKTSGPLAAMLFGGLVVSAHAQEPTEAVPSASLSPGWAESLPPGPDPRVKITEAYAKLVASDAYFWAWPMVNMYNRRLYFSGIDAMRYAGTLPQAPINRLTMLTDDVDPAERNVACPNQDVVYGIGALALDLSPVVIQVPDFGDRFWVYQVVDLRTDSFVELGQMYGTTPGFYLLVGPNWKGRRRKGSRRYSAAPRIPDSPRLASFKTTRRRTRRRSRTY